MFGRKKKEVPKATVIDDGNPVGAPLADVVSALRDQGHHVPDDVTPLHLLVMRGMATTWVSLPGQERGPLGTALGRKAGDSHGDLYLLACAAIASLPGEVWVARGGCGGEATIAGFTSSSADELVARVCEVFEVEDPLWSSVERVPLLKR